MYSGTQCVKEPGFGPKKVNETLPCFPPSALPGGSPARTTGASLFACTPSPPSEKKKLVLSPYFYDTEKC